MRKLHKDAPWNEVTLKNGLNINKKEFEKGGN